MLLGELDRTRQHALVPTYYDRHCRLTSPSAMAVASSARKAQPERHESLSAAYAADVLAARINDRSAFMHKHQAYTGEVCLQTCKKAQALHLSTVLEMRL